MDEDVHRVSCNDELGEFNPSELRFGCEHEESQAADASAVSSNSSDK
jgi:hypothetical protein